MTSASPATRPPRIDGRRLLATIDELSKIGATNAQGCTRLARSEADREARSWTCQQMADLDLVATLVSLTQDEFS